MILQETFKITLAAARVNAGMTQEQVARKMHVSKRTVVNWEKSNANPSFVVLNALCDLYNVPLNYIFLPLESTLSDDS